VPRFQNMKLKKNENFSILNVLIDKIRVTSAHWETLHYCVTLNSERSIYDFTVNWTFRRQDDLSGFVSINERLCEQKITGISWGGGGGGGGGGGVGGGA
jgi:hypothetical protein